MAGLWARLFPKKTLAGLREPARVSIQARMLSPNTLTSSLSRHTAALIGWRFFVHYVDPSDRQSRERYDLLWACVFGDDVTLSTPQGTVLVPAEARVLRPGVTGHGIPLDVALPPEAAHVLQMPAAKRGVVYYDELLIRNGDAVRLTAIVAPSAPVGASAYRSSGAPHADYTARGDLGDTLLEDLPFASG